MRFTGFIGPSYTLQSVAVDCQRTVNLYPEVDEIGTGKEGEVASLVGTPGLRLLASLPLGPVRGVYTDSTGQLWAVGGSLLYQVSSLAVLSRVGVLNSSSGPVSFSDNGLQMVLVDGTHGYQYTFASRAFTAITDPNFLGATHASFMDGYFIFNQPGSQRFYLSPGNAVTPLDPLDFGTAEAGPEPLVGHAVLQEQLYLFSQKHLEIFYDSGVNSFPFERIQGAVFDLGCMAAFSIAKLQNAVYWLAQDSSGRGVVYRMQGLQPQRISTLAIEHVIAGLGDLSSARAFTYSQAGHAFYCLNLPGAASTWVFDTTANLWHERASLLLGASQRHLADCHAFAYGMNVVGDFASGNLYVLDPAVYTDNGAPIVRERAAPHLSKSLKRLFHGAFQLDLETGVGTDGVGQGAAPQAILQWSNDGGQTWSSEHYAALGPIGARTTRVIWRRLGSARDRVYRVRIVDPVKVTMIGAELDVEEGGS